MHVLVKCCYGLLIIGDGQLQAELHNFAPQKIMHSGILSHLSAVYETNIKRSLADVAVYFV